MCCQSSGDARHLWGACLLSTQKAHKAWEPFKIGIFTPKMQAWVKYLHGSTPGTFRFASCLYFIFYFINKVIDKLGYIGIESHYKSFQITVTVFISFPL